MAKRGRLFKKQELTIESNIPLPTNMRGKGSKYPFEKMRVGDSFWSNTSADSLYNYSWKWAKNYFKFTKAEFPGRGKVNHSVWKFVVRTENNGSRIWRVK